MTTVSTEFTAPCTQDRAILAVQDLANSLQWPILELTSSRVVITGPKLQPLQMYDLPQISILLKEVSLETLVKITISTKMPSMDFGGVKRKLTGIMGQIVNGLSVRVQTRSIAINPTVSLGDGQGESESEVPAPGIDRLAQLERLQRLFESGVLTREEFDIEKHRILRQS